MQEKVSEIIQKLREADAVLVGASNGLSISEGYHLFANNEAFLTLFGDFQKKYGFQNLLEGMYARLPIEEKWAYMARMIKHYTNDYQITPTMQALKKLVGNKPYFIVTSNGEGHFEAAGFETDKIYEIEGNMLTMQCSKACHNKFYPTHDVVKKLVVKEKDGKVPKQMIPTCPICGEPMQIHSVVEQNFIPDNKASERMQKFILQYKGKKLFILELGIGWRNQLIKAPLMKLADEEAQATYVTVNKGEIYITDSIKEKSYGLDGDMMEILQELADAI